MEKLLTSPRLYWLFRIGWLERAVFLLFRALGASQRQTRAFQAVWQGFDVSYYQGAVNFAKLLAYGARFLILRVTYAAKKDIRFEEYIAQAFGLLPLAVYGFYDPAVSPQSQALALVAALEPHKHKVRRVWLDFEFWWSGAYADPKWWKVYRDAIRSAGYKTGIYTRATWWNPRVGAYAAEFATDPVWAAQYSPALTLIPKGWTQAMIWQDGVLTNGLQVGVSSPEVDHNLWNTAFDFDTEWGGAIVTPPDNGGTMIPGKARESKGNLPSVRSAPSRGASKVGALAAGATIDFVEIVPSTMAHVADLSTDRWFKRPDGTYVNYQLGGVEYFTILSQPVTDTVPPQTPAGVPAVVEFNLAAGSSYAIKDAAGKVIIEGKVP